MAGFQRHAHHFGVASGVERVVRATIGHRDDRGDHLLAAHAPGVEEFGHAEPAAPFLTIGIDVDADDLVRTGQARALDDVEADAAQAEDHDIVAHLHLGGVDHRAHARGHPAADIAAALERRVLADLGQRDLGQDGEVGEGRTTHIMKDRLALVGKAGRAVGHQPLALGRADRGAEVRLAAQARLTLAAFGGVERDDMVARHQAGDASPHFADDARALMAQDRREDALAVEPVQRIGIGMADAGRHDLDQDFARLGAFQIDFDDFEGLLRFEGDGGAGFHGGQLP